jgi:prepilin-type N-terminal cleavage/methylation domain-containing protein
MKNHKNQRKAFTLVETMIALAVFSTVLYIGYTLMNRTFLGMDRQKQSLESLHEARSFLMNIEKDLREALEVIELNCVYTGYLFDERYALLNKLTLLVPARTGNGTQRVTYTYEGPLEHRETGQKKTIYREVEGGTKKALITKQMDYLKVWGTDGVIFRSRDASEPEASYVSYLTQHYYHPSNPVTKGLRNLRDIKGIELQLSMHELMDKANKPIKQRKFITRVYPRMLNAKYD